MNIQHIKRACMNARTAMIYDTPDGQQWIGNGAAAYLIEGIHVDERALTFLFNLSEKQQSEMYMLERSIDDPRFTDTPYDGQEAPAIELGMITYLDEDRLALKTDGGVMFIRYAYVSAIKEKYRSFSVRWWDGRPLIAVYDGMFCKALIVPMGNNDVDIIREKAAGNERDAVQVEGTRSRGQGGRGDGRGADPEHGRGSWGCCRRRGG